MPATSIAPQIPPKTPADDAPHILIVDDDRRIRDLLSRFLAIASLPPTIPRKHAPS
jgi:PleD family two-component response regulator